MYDHTKLETSALDFALYAFRKFRTILPVILISLSLCSSLILQLDLKLDFTNHRFFHGLAHVVDLPLPSIFEPSLIPSGS